MNGELCTPPRDVDLCENGKPSVLSLKYTGDDCTASNHSQEAGNVVCEGDPNFEASVRIVVTDKRKFGDKNENVWFDGIVALGGMFEADSANAGEGRLSPTTVVYVFDLSGNLLQQVEFHTSCSQPLFFGDQFGSVQLLGYVAEVKQGGGSSSTTKGNGKKP